MTTDTPSLRATGPTLRKCDRCDKACQEYAAKGQKSPLAGGMYPLSDVNFFLCWDCARKACGNLIRLLAGHDAAVKYRRLYPPPVAPSSHDGQVARSARSPSSSSPPK